MNWAEAPAIIIDKIINKIENIEALVSMSDTSHIKNAATSKADIVENKIKIVHAKIISRLQ
jgi:hypothetical protein